jgi:hypothetical protein
MSAQPPASSANGAALSSAPAVQLRDGAGNAVNTSGTTVSVGLVGAGATLGGTLSAATAAGVATFPGLTITGTVGSYNLAFASGGLTGIQSSAISLTPGSPQQLSMATQPPATSSSGNALVPSPAVQLRDGSGNATPVSGIDINASLNGAGGMLTGSTTATTNGSGIATFSGLGISGSGSYSLTFSGPSLTSVTSSAINVTLPAVQLGVLSQPSPNATNGSPFGAQPSVQLRDVNGNLVAQSGVTVSAVLTGGSGTLNGTASVVTVNGVATFTNLGITGLVGNYSLTFSASGLTGATSNAIALAAGAATQVTFTVDPGGQTTNNGQALNPQPVLQLRDPQGNAVTTAGVAVSASRATGPGSASLSGALATTDGNGTATFTALTISGAPALSSYTIRFAATGVAGTATSGVINVFLFEEAAAGTDPLHNAGDLSGTKSVAADTFDQARLTKAPVDRAQVGRSSVVDFEMFVPNSFVKIP